MTDEKPLSSKMRLAWAGAATLCAAVLVLLWITAQRIKDAKVAARGGGDPIAALSSDQPTLITLKPGETERFAHFRLSPGQWGDFEVWKADGTPCVRFINIKLGDVRRWQEAEFTILSMIPLTLSATLRPGASCFGRGWYIDLKKGLRIELPGGRTVTVVDIDREKAEARTLIASNGESALTLLSRAKPEMRLLTVHLQLETKEGPLRLLVEEE